MAQPSRHLYQDSFFMISFVLFLVFTNGLMLTQIYNSKVNGALSTSFISTATGLLTTVAGLFMFGEAANITIPLIVGITIACSGAFI